MAFNALTEQQEQALKALEAAVKTRTRADLSMRLAESRLPFIELTHALIDGDPWFFEQAEDFQATLRASLAEDEAFERRRLADALTWLANTHQVIAGALVTLEGDGNA